MFLNFSVISACSVAKDVKRITDENTIYQIIAFEGCSVRALHGYDALRCGPLRRFRPSYAGCI